MQYRDCACTDMKIISTEWSAAVSNTTDASFIGPTPGPTTPLSSDPMDIFSLFFDSTLVELIVTETNTYAKLCLESEGKQTTWSTTEEKIQASFGFQILMGLNHKPEIRDYWSRDELPHYAPIASRISRDRYEEISRYIHFVDNESLPKRGEPGFHRLQKILPVLTHLKGRFLAAYNPHQQNAIDEAMVSFKGKSVKCGVC